MKRKISKNTIMQRLKNEAGLNSGLDLGVSSSSSHPYEDIGSNIYSIKSIYTGFAGNLKFSPIFSGDTVKAYAWIRLTGHRSDYNVIGSNGSTIAKPGDESLAQKYVEQCCPGFNFENTNCTWHYVYMAFLYEPDYPADGYFSYYYQGNDKEYEMFDASYWTYWWNPGIENSDELGELALMQYVPDDALSLINEDPYNEYRDSRWQWEQVNNGKNYGN